jgi:outer membrane protein OmpA-like peptidoglycan-associated protein
VALLVAVSLAGVVPSSFAQEKNVATGTSEPPAEIGVLGGAGFHDAKLNPAREEGIGALGGVRLGYRLVPAVGWFADFTWSTFNPREVVPFPDNIDVATGRSGLEFLFWPKMSSPTKAFLAASAGIMDFNWSKDFSSYRPGLASVGIGLRTVVNNRWAFRVEGRGSRTWGSHNDRIVQYPAAPGEPQGDHIGAVVTNYQALAGISLLFLGGSKDADGDGVPDNLDKCPDTPMGWMVDARGCPLDSDNDGVPDGADRCANTPTGATVDNKGCPVDSDNDGVPDGIDTCPNTPAGATVDNKGCPTDSDNDGVPDGIDTCPNTPSGAIVDNKGCPMDSDGDGVYDGIDKCPGTPPSTPVDPQGCPQKAAAPPAIPQGKEPLVLQGVNFISGKATLTPSSAATLDNVAASMKQYPDVKVEIGGHTDSVGSDEMNQKLSEARAETVKQYLVSQGVSASRLTTRGYGESKPIGDNSTPEGRAMNRRIELIKIG